MTPGLSRAASRLLLPLLLGSFPVLAQGAPSAVPAPRSSSVQRVPARPPLSPELQALFTKARPASLRLEDCPDTRCLEPNGVGSGVLISSDGLALTAYHVVYDSQHLTALTLNRKRYPVTVVGFDDQHDLALIRLTGATGLPFVPISVRAPSVGQTALAIGNSGGSFLGPRSGKLLALDAEAGRADFPPGTLALSAPLAPGDSGGPVLNTAGELMGITSYISIRSDDDDSQAPSVPGAHAALPNVTAFAVPVTSGSAILAELRRGVKREAPVVGISTQGDLRPDVFESLGLGKVPGFVFFGLVPGGPAARAGLRPLEVVTQGSDGTPTKVRGDVITAVDGKRVTDFDGFLAAIRSYQVGDRVTLTVYRDGSSTPISVPVTLAPRTIALNQGR